ncbi:hypothetical protein ACU8KH_06616 [Lachancea thermotolerans]
MANGTICFFNHANFSCYRCTDVEQSHIMRNSHKEPVHQQRAQTSHDIRFRKELRALELHLPTLSGHVEESSDS